MTFQKSATFAQRVGFCLSIVSLCRGCFACQESRLDEVAFGLQWRGVHGATFLKPQVGSCTCWQVEGRPQVGSCKATIVLAE